MIWVLERFFSFLFAPTLENRADFSVSWSFTGGRTPWTCDQLISRRLPNHRTTKTQKNAHTHQTPMAWVGFEPTIPASERAKTVYDSDRSATVTGIREVELRKSLTITQGVTLPVHKTTKFPSWKYIYRSFKGRILLCLYKTKTPWPLVRKRTIPTERPPLVGEVSANFCGYRVSRGQRDGSPRR
jgi:hypothetical protein